MEMCVADPNNTADMGNKIEYSRVLGSRKQNLDLYKGNKHRQLGNHVMETDMESGSDKENLDLDSTLSEVERDDSSVDSKGGKLTNRVGPAYLLGVCERDENLNKIILRNLFNKEKNSKLNFNPSAMYVRYRHLLVEWMAEVCEEYNLPYVICHLSIRYLDEILSRENVAKKNLQLIALCCILIASKYREPEQNIPSVGELNECSDFAYDATRITDMEMVLLKILKWKLEIPIAQDFIMYYVRQPLIFEDDRLKNGGLVRTKEHSLLLQYVKFFVELAVSDYSMQSYLPSHVAAATICCSRIATCISHKWHFRLEQLTGYSLDNISKCKDHLYGIFLQKYPAEARAIVTSLSNPDRADLDDRSSCCSI
jgi:cyclin A